jgi:hypothetical protein
MNSQAEACPKAVSRWCAAKRDAARAYWRWSFWCMAQFEYGEPGVCMNFEETEEKLTANVASLGFDLRDLIRRKKLLIDYVSLSEARLPRLENTTSMACSSVWLTP